MWGRILAFSAGAACGAIATAAAILKERKPIFDIEKGDLIQWDLNGAFQFESPKKVRKIIEDPKGCFVLVEGSETGIPIEQAVKLKDEEE